MLSARMIAFDIVSISPIIEADSLRDCLDRGMIVVDTRAPARFSSGHIRGARNLPAAFLFGPTGNPVEPQVFARLMSRLGISPESHVLIVDGGEGQAAAMAHWVFQVRGHGRSSILNGGSRADDGAANDLERGPAPLVPVEYLSTRSGPDSLASAADVLEALESGDCIIDVRTIAEFRGQDGHGVRPGRIPGAQHVEWTENLEASDHGWRYRSSNELSELYLNRGMNPLQGGARFIVYCHAGPRAMVSYAALKHAGGGDVRVYVPGWSEWGTREDLPAESG